MSNRFEDAVQAVIDGDGETLKGLLGEDRDLVHARSTRKHRATLLHYVGANGVENENQRTPPNAVEICRILLEAGAKPDATADIYGKGSMTMGLLVTSIHPCLAHVQGDLVRELVRGGAAVDGPQNDGNPLHAAISFGYEDAVDALHECGARISNLIEAAAVGDLERVEDEAGNVDPSAVDIPWGSHENRFAWPPPAGRDPKAVALGYASRMDRLPVIEFLLGFGVDVNAKLASNDTPLHWAGFYHSNAAIPVLLDNGADIDLENSDGKTALQLTEQSGNEKGADIIARASS